MTTQQQGDAVIKGGALEPSQAGKDLLDRATDMEARYRSRIKAQRDRLETMQHRLLELLGVIAECRQTIDEDWVDLDDDARVWVVDGKDINAGALAEYVDDLLQRLRMALLSGVSTDRRNVAGVDGSGEEHVMLASHMIEVHGVSQVYLDMPMGQLRELHERMRHDDHQHKDRV